MIADLWPNAGMKESGVPWLGEVPQHWDVLRLKYSADLVNEKVNGAASELPYTGLEHIESWTGKRLATDAETSSDGQASVHRAGDVLFGKLRPYLAKAYAAEKDGICTSELLVLRPKTLLQRFLRDYLLNQSLISVVDSSTYGAKMPRASWDFIGSLPVLVPPLDEQRTIVRFLDRETARIDTLMEKKRRQIELLHEKRAAVISHAVTKGLDPNVPMKDSGIDLLGTMPAHWTVSRLMFLTPPHRQVMYGIVLPGPHVEGGIPIVKAGNVAPGKLRRELLKCTTSEIETPFARARLKAGDLVFAIRGSIGAVEMVPEDVSGSNITQDVARVAPQSGVDPTWLLYALESSPTQEQVAAATLGATVKGLNIFELKRLYLPVPPPDEQRQLGEWIRVRVERMAEVIAKVETSIDRLLEYRTALISATVTGRIDVRKEVA